MVSKAGLRREEREKRSRVQNGLAAAGSALIGLLLFIMPRTGRWIATDLSLSFAISIWCAWHCWGLKPRWITRLCFLVLHAGLFVLLGWIVWPHIRVSPANVTFAGFQNETFNFSVRNETDDDVYDVQIPFFLETHDHLDSKFSAKVIPNGEPAPRIFGDYNYCYGKRSDIHKVLPNEQEALVVHVSHITPMGNRSFSVTYTGGEKLEANAERPTFILTPYSYSDTQGTIGVRGNFRACKFVSANESAVPQ